MQGNLSIVCKLHELEYAERGRERNGGGTSHIMIHIKREQHGMALLYKCKCSLARCLSPMHTC
jgi:hypothetical protein